MTDCRQHARPRRATPTLVTTTLFAVVVSASSFAAAQVAPSADRAATRVDRFSFANADSARVTHVALDLRADFGARSLAGTATLTVSRTRGRELVLDTNGLAIDAVTLPGGEPLPFELRPADPVKGRALVVTFPGEPDRTAGPTLVVVRYRTSPDAGALQWLQPAQTAGKVKPYLFSQGQAIQTRSWIPTQDSPGIRQTYEARLTVPDGLRAVMSAEPITPDGEPAAGGRAFRFKMTQPIAPYLIALAIGDIARRDVGPRTAVYAEPSVVDSAAREFGELEQMLKTAETLYGPYRWGRYDVLVLPPSFPYGGMENPTLTFLTPTLLAGDRSLVSVVAHELAHSWSGNLVTNATWRDFWLNEGFTTYIELRIMEALYGPARAGMLESLERGSMMKELDALGATSPATQLHLPDSGDDPDASLSDLAYTKGSAFLRMLEANVGRARLDAYLRGYFDRHAFAALTTPEFATDLRTHLFATEPARYDALRVDEWLYRPGLPPNATPARSELLERAAESAARFAKDGRGDLLDVSTWSAQQWVGFLDALPRTMSTERLQTLDQVFRMSERTNSEVLHAWLQLAVAHRYDPAVPALERFLTSQGRRKFVQPLFEALVASDWGRPVARRIYEEARGTYHPLTASAVDRLFAK